MKLVACTILAFRPIWCRAKSFFFALGHNNDQFRSLQANSRSRWLLALPITSFLKQGIARLHCSLLIRISLMPICRPTSARSKRAAAQSTSFSAFRYRWLIPDLWTAKTKEH
uniref:Uncharacterized protein n=1 Tax=Bionectria ochroleuca TaxID=29856 RepID=A0A0B7JP91_BIOOC